MKKMNKPVVLIVGTLFLVGSAAFAEGTASHSTSDTSGKSLSETTNSGDTSVNMGSTNSEVGGVRPAGQNAGEADEIEGMGSTTDSPAADSSMGSTTGTTGTTGAGSAKDMTHKKSAKGTAYEGSMKSIPHASITFEPGSAMLSEASRTSLRDLITEAKAAGTIEQVTVAAWSDKALPTQKGAELPEADRDLAAKRAEAISSVLKTEFDVADVDTFNMAERANWLARTFGTRQAELKSIFAKKDADTPVTNAEFEVIKNEGGPSEAVVVVEREMPNR